MGLAIIIYTSGSRDKMKINQTNIKLKIEKLDSEIKLLVNKINEISWQRKKYQQFYNKLVVSETDSNSVT